MFYEGCTLEEIKAYRELEKQTFDFGQGKMKMEGGYGSEDIYYKMCLLEECKGKRNCKQPKAKKKVRLNKYERKKIDKNKLNKLKELTWWGVCDDGEYLKRLYLSRSRKNAKRFSNRKVRRYKGGISKGGHYRKFYDYWWKIW